MPLVPPDNIANAVLLSIGNTLGTGFFIASDEFLYFATAAHVLFDKASNVIAKEAVLTCLGSDLMSKCILQINCEKLLADGDLRKHKTADVTVARIASFEKIDERRAIRYVPAVSRLKALPSEVSILGLPMHRIAKFDEVQISEDVVLFSYPTSLGTNIQFDRFRPLLRRGIIAGKTDDGRIVMDCPVYFGNSGGLVVQIETTLTEKRIKGIGLAIKMIPFVEEIWSRQFNTSIGTRFENSGYSLVEPIDRVIELF